MHSDPIIAILFTAIICFIFGFFAATIICCRRIRRANIDGWKEGVRFYQERETQWAPRR
jgi:hypothetical protein